MSLRLLLSKLLTFSCSVAWDVVKQVGAALWEGKDLVTVTLPVYLFEPRSFLERLADGFSFAPIYLKQAAGKCLRFS